MINPKEIYFNYTISYGGVTGIIDILCDNTLIKFSDNISISTISQLLLYAYLFKKNNIIITNIIVYNPITGEINNLDITKIDIF
jgi:hypothetical protein